jgi:hypothetical protein
MFQLIRRDLNDPWMVDCDDRGKHTDIRTIRVLTCATPIVFRERLLLAPPADFADSAAAPNMGKRRQQQQRGLTGRSPPPEPSYDVLVLMFASSRLYEPA